MNYLIKWKQWSPKHKIIFPPFYSCLMSLICIMFHFQLYLKIIDSIKKKIYTLEDEVQILIKYSLFYPIFTENNGISEIIWVVNSVIVVYKKRSTIHISWTRIEFISINKTIIRLGIPSKSFSVKLRPIRMLLYNCLKQCVLIIIQSAPLNYYRLSFSHLPDTYQFDNSYFCFLLLSYKIKISFIHSLTRWSAYNYNSHINTFEILN